VANGEVPFTCDEALIEELINGGDDDDGDDFTYGEDGETLTTDRDHDEDDLTWNTERSESSSVRITNLDDLRRKMMNLSKSGTNSHSITNTNGDKTDNGKVNLKNFGFGARKIGGGIARVAGGVINYSSRAVNAHRGGVNNGTTDDDGTMPSSLLDWTKKKVAATERNATAPSGGNANRTDDKDDGIVEGADRNSDAQYAEAVRTGMCGL